MVDPNLYKFDTLALHAGQHADPTTGARAVPIYQTTSFVFRDTDHAASLFNLERSGHIYSRISNPTNAVLEERISPRSKAGVGAIATASRARRRMHLAIATLMGAGSAISSASAFALWRQRTTCCTHTLPRFGIETTFVDPRNPSTHSSKAIKRPNTRLLFGETLGNPGLDVHGHAEKVSDVAHEAGLPLLVDNDLHDTPWLMRPVRSSAPTS